MYDMLYINWMVVCEVPYNGLHVLSGACRQVEFIYRKVDSYLYYHLGLSKGGVYKQVKSMHRWSL